MLSPFAGGQGKGQHAKNHCQGGHENRAQAHLGGHQQGLAAAHGRFVCAVAVVQAFSGSDGKVKQQNRILGDQAHEHDHTDDGKQRQGGLKQHQRQDHANQGERQRGHQCQRLQKTFELAGQNHVDKNNRHHQRRDSIGKRLFHVFGGTTKLVAVTIRQWHGRHDGLDFF